MGVSIIVNVIFEISKIFLEKSLGIIKKLIHAVDII